MLSADDALSRCIVFNKAFVGGVHVNSHLFIFEKRAADGMSHESGVLRSRAVEDSEVHAIGCGIAVIQNARKSPPPGPDRKYYCGFRTASVQKLVQSGDKYNIHYKLDGGHEGSEPWHVDIALEVISTDKNERATIKADAGLNLAGVFGDPVEFICPNDRVDSFHPLNQDVLNLRKGLPQFQVVQSEVSQSRELTQE